MHSLRKNRWKSIASKVLSMAVLTVLAFFVLMPLLWMISMSLKSGAEIAEYPPKLIPQVAHFENFTESFKRGNFARYTLNTLFISILTMIGNVLVNSYVAYGFAKIKFKGREKWFTLVLATMMIPSFVTLVPTYILFSKIGWVGSYLPLIVPAFFGNAFNIFMMRQFYRTIPDSMIEAAKLEGASHFRIWSLLMTPLVKPLMATVALMSFKGAWNDFQGPLLYVNSEKLYTLQIGLQAFKGQVQTQWNYLMAMSLYSMLPILLLFFFFQNYFISGISITGSDK